MKFKELMTFWKKEATEDRQPPPEDEWPVSVNVLDLESFDEFIERFPFTLIDFHSPYCGPCKAMSPRMRKLSKRYEKEVAFGKIDITKNKEVAERYDINRVPVFIVFRYGRKIRYMKGKKSLSDLRKVLDDVLNEY